MERVARWHLHGHASTLPNGAQERHRVGESVLLAVEYKYIWKTDKAWAGTCRQLVIRFSDSSLHYANFKFK